jgi:hypothetical protein
MIELEEYLNENGNITDLSNYTIEVSKEGYDDNSVQIKVNETSRDFEIVLTLTPEPVVEEVVQNSGGGGGDGSCVTSWVCNDWSLCIGGQQTRTCEKEVSYCHAPLNQKPGESRICFENTGLTFDENGTIVEEVLETPQQIGITGAVVGAFGTPLLGIPLLFLIGVAIAFLVLEIRKNKSPKKTKKKSKK